MTLQIPIRLDFKSGQPAYLQIASQVKAAAASGMLQPGDQLPSIRELAEHLRINRNTVSKAYEQLEHEGVVEMQQGKGVFLTGQPSPFSRLEQEKLLHAAVDAAIVQAHHFRIPDDELMNILRQRLADFARRRDSNE